MLGRAVMGGESCVRWARMVLGGLTVTLGIAAATPAVSSAAESLSPWWAITLGARPTELPPGGSGIIVVEAQNRGDGATAGTVTVEDTLPPNIEALGVKTKAGGTGTSDRGPLACSFKVKGEGSGVRCTFGSFETTNGKGEKEVVQEALPAYEQIELQITVRVRPASVSGEESTAVVSGGGAARAASLSRAIPLGTTEKFGFEDFQLIPEEAGGAIATQAGSHPFQLTNVVALNQKALDSRERPVTVGLPKTIAGELPPGFIGNATPFVQCTDSQFAKEPKLEGSAVVNECPAQSAVGVATVAFTEPQGSYSVATAPIFNVTPLPGEPVRFGFKALGLLSAFLDTSIRTGNDYGVTVASNNISELVSVVGVKLTFWGVPGDPRHDHQRGWECLDGFGTCPPSTGATPPPLLDMPTSCEAPFSSTLRGESWPEGGGSSPQTAEPALYTLPEAIDGCNHLPFTPSIRVTPDGNAASSPTGLSVDVHVPQSAILNPNGLSESAIRSIVVALPEGVAVDPAGGDGLQACTESEVGYQPELSAGENLRFTPTLVEPFCPSASKVGTVDISTPLLPPGQDVRGAVYLATQNANPFGSLIAMYIVAEDPISGAVVKLPGEVHLTETGQLIGTFKNTPQLAFEDADLHFFGGERAPLATPAHCGPYTTKAVFGPWSGNESVNSESTFQITSGPNGSPCPGASLPFAPTLTAGSVNIQAGGLTPFTTTMSREDGSQNLGAIKLRMPPGLSGLLTNVKLCPEQQANEGTCGPESLIGETTVSAGVGNDPVTVTGGKVYITEKYEGSPFGLSIVNPVKAGPFDLENTPTNHPPCDCIVVRARIDVDRTTAQLTITTDTSGPHAIPHIIEGVPVQIKHVNVIVSRPGFTFNPTNCAPLSITGAITSVEGATQSLTVPLQVANCANLKFKPALTAVTSGHTSRSKGTSFSVKLTYPKAAFGSQANISKVKVDLPKQLPSRLTTLQKACLAVKFEANPASCPPASVVGRAKVITPLLPVPLEGPAYFVSHGGEAFPSLTIVLSGYGVTVDLVGSTFIRKGVTSSTFKTTPDVPFNSFELNLPAGLYSALGSNGNLCKSKLLMPTSFVAQNGAEIHQSTKIGVTGCAKPKKHKAKKAKHRH